MFYPQALKEEKNEKVFNIDVGSFGCCFFSGKQFVCQRTSYANAWNGKI
jgi:hypothetical protein